MELLSGGELQDEIKTQISILKTETSYHFIISMLHRSKYFKKIH